MHAQCTARKAEARPPGELQRAISATSRVLTIGAFSAIEAQDKSDGTHTLVAFVGTIYV
jgi:hypothetical protein